MIVSLLCSFLLQGQEPELMQAAFQKMEKANAVEYAIFSRVEMEGKVVQVTDPKKPLIRRIKKPGLVTQQTEGKMRTIRNGKTQTIVYLDQGCYQVFPDSWEEKVEYGRSIYCGFEPLVNPRVNFTKDARFSTTQFDGRSCVAMTYTARAGEITFYVDAKSLLPAGKVTNQTKGQVMDITEVYRDVKFINSMKTSEFEWKPPTGYFNTAEAADLATGSVAPDFSLKNSTGRTVSLSKLLETNKAVLIDFYFVDCAPCRESHKHLQKLWEAHQVKGLTIVGLNAIDSMPAISKYRNSAKLTFPHLKAASETIKGFGAGPYPSLYLVGPGRKVLWSAKGPKNDQVDRALAAAGF